MYEFGTAEKTLHWSMCLANRNLVWEQIKNLNS